MSDEAKMYSQRDVHDNSIATPRKRKKLGGCTGKGFMPGQSGNPGGRLKMKLITDLYRKIFSDPANLALLEARIMRFLRSKSSRFSIPETFLVKEITDRLEGRVPAPVEVSATGSITVYDAVAAARARVMRFEQKPKALLEAPAAPLVIDAQPDPAGEPDATPAPTFPEWARENGLNAPLPPPLQPRESPRRAKRIVVQ